MRLKEAQIKRVCEKILESLHTKQLVKLKKSETQVLAKMEEIMTRDLRIEDDINREADKLVDQYAATAGADIDRSRLFQLIKKQLVKDRGAVI